MANSLISKQTQKFLQTILDLKPGFARKYFVCKWEVLLKQFGMRVNEEEKPAVRNRRIHQINDRVMTRSIVK
jgi:hypothetical protein